MSHAAPVPTLSAGPSADSGFAFTPADFRRVADMLYKDAGIHLAPAKSALVYSRLVRRLRALGLSSFKEYCDLVDSDRGGEERGRMLSALTTNVTQFFREPHHFDALRTRILPEALRLARAGGPVRLWSAACSTGQEPYSMAMTVLALEPKAAELDIKILGTDIDEEVIRQAREATYADNLVRQIPAELRSRWLKPAENRKGDWVMADAARRLVRFNKLNLLGDWPFKGKFDAIFCRNVAIYFDDATQAALWPRFARHLLPTGSLFIGHSERIDAPCLEADGLTSYRLPQLRSGRAA